MTFTNMIVAVISVAVLANFAMAIPIPNSIKGNAEVDCGEDYIDINWLLEDEFNGRVYVVGHANDPECSLQPNDTLPRRASTSIKIPKDKCGVTTFKSTNPPGLYVNTKVMVSFHKNFVTKVDRGFEISCFYMEVDKTVTFPLIVSMKDLAPLTFLAEMPRCRYEVIDPASQEAATVVAVGDPLLHKWTCESNAPDLWCMTVHSCFVEDGQGTQATILDDEGCEKDQFLLRNLEYGTQTPEMRAGHLMAQQEAHAFKFADRVVVNFQCSIQLEIKGDDGCDLPVCVSGRGQGSRRRVAREVPLETITVRSRQVDVLDPMADFGLSSDDFSFRSSLDRVRGQTTPVDCIHQHTMIAMYASTLLTVCLVAIAITLLVRRHKE